MGKTKTKSIFMYCPKCIREKIELADYPVACPNCKTILRYNSTTRLVTVINDDVTVGTIDSKESWLATR